MKIYSINSVCNTGRAAKSVNGQKNISEDKMSFRGKHSFAKAGALAFGTGGAIAAAIGTVIISGGVALPAVVAYGGVAAVGGAVFGNELDKGPDDKKEDK